MLVTDLEMLRQSIDKWFADEENITRTCITIADAVDQIVARMPDDGQKSEEEKKMFAAYRLLAYLCNNR